MKIMRKGFSQAPKPLKLKQKALLIFKGRLSACLNKRFYLAGFGCAILAKASS